MKETLEHLVDVERFGMRALHENVWPLIEEHRAVRRLFPPLRDRLGSLYQKLGYLLLRNVFLIELVKVPAIETTKVRTRWYPQLEGDQRWASFDDCLTIAHDLITGLADGWLDVPEHEEALRLFFRFPLLPYEGPLDYQSRPAPSDNQTKIHRRGNLVWMATETMLRTLKLRQYLTSGETSPDAVFFDKVLNDKIKVKTYLTDRALTGPHKTNREKRWEVPPQSVQFADRRTCMAIEYTLITQLCAFDGFPDNFRNMLQEQGILPQELETFRCPITLDPMSFPAFRVELMNPTHGKSNFQVGHLNPLKLDDPAGVASGHTADNIGWISADGNRVQGSLSLANVRSLLRRIASNYEAKGWV